ncbi:MAG: hypothetical protein ACYCOS_06810 [Sulfobacillus sp.]
MISVIRKQIFLPTEQDDALKQLSKQTGQSEGALVRQGIALRLRQERIAEVDWEALLLEWSQRAVDGKARSWHREDLYAEPTSG